MSKRESKKEQREYAKRLAQIDEQYDAQQQTRSTHGKRKKTIGNKLPNLKKQRHWATTLRAGSLLLFFGIILACMLYLVAPLSKINQISVVGNHQVTRNDVLTATKIKTGNFIWQAVWHSNQISLQAQQQNPEIKRIQVKATGLQAVKLVVSENKIVGFLKRGTSYYPILASGKVKQNKLSQPESGQPIFTGFKSTVALQRTIKQYEQLTSTVKTGVSEIKFQPTKNDSKRLRIFMNDGNEILVKYSSLTKKMPYYPSIAQNMSANGVVNLELGAYSYSYGTKDH